MSYQKIPAADAATASKHGIDLKIYDMDIPAVNIVTVETKEGHSQEFRLKTIDFIYLILDGFGTFVLDDEKVAVEKGDMLIVKAGTRIHYFGQLKMVLASTPAWREDDEEHIRFVDKSESPYYEKP
jgi:mannose-6-phosphate isomerase-like protein (cupin superfamily)